MAFRSKSPRRVLKELGYLLDRWRLDFVEAVDNILDMRYFRDLIPELARSGPRAQIFYEVKANLSREQVRLLRQAGIGRIQPGIESLSDHVLKLMRKGTTALRNVQLLKWCAEDGIVVDWNLLHGFPGETREDYAAMLELLRAIRFLPPPGACGPVRLDRFSPYYDDPAGFGLINVRPMAPYAYLYPFDDASLHRIAYYFDYDYARGSDPTGYADEVIAFADAWQRTPKSGRLLAVESAGGALTLIDTRSDAAFPEVRLEGPERAAYDYCDELRSGAAVVDHLRRAFPRVAFDASRVLGFLDSLVANRLMVTDGVHYLGLALRARAPTAGPPTDPPVASGLTVVAP
jgi:ribosomal peptide maturation radical SAM protein 1